jgi:UPF0755 protein
MALNKKRRILGVLVLVLMLIGIALMITAYTLVFASAMNLEPEQTRHIHIRTGWDFAETMQMLKEEEILRYPWAFEQLARQKKYPQLVRPGRFLVTSEMSNSDLVNLLRTGKQDPVNLIFNNIRTPEQLAGRVARQIEADSVSLIHVFRDSTYHQKFGIPLHQIAMLFIPNTYEFFWNTSAKGFIERMHREYESFWNDERQEKLNSIRMSRAEVVTMASIIEMETSRNDEKARIAGVYMNRLRIGMRLQADPTLVFAHGDFSIRRVLNRHKLIDSPYNTYKYGGLPPGPIAFPSISSIDAVLNFETHDYFYFAAREDFSGYHNFARTYQQHLANARRYHRALNENNIR